MVTLQVGTYHITLETRPVPWRLSGKGSRWWNSKVSATSLPGVDLPKAMESTYPATNLDLWSGMILLEPNLHRELAENQ